MQRAMEYYCSHSKIKSYHFGNQFPIFWKNSMDRFREIDLFVQVVEAGNISRAAERLGLPVSTASRHLNALESRLGARLLSRTTRQLALTDVGAEFYRRCTAILSDMEEAEAVAQEAVVKPSGLLRVTASLSFCLLHIEPLLPAFKARYPEITVDVVAENRYLNVVENNVDVAIRTRQFEADDNLTIRRLAVTKRVLAASPLYLSRFGVPKVPQDLASHQMLIYNHANHPRELPFEKAGKFVTVHIDPSISTSDGQIAVRAALHDMGILVQPKYIIFDSLEAGELVTVLDDWDLPRLTMNIAFQTRQYLPAKVRVFIDALTERFRLNDFENRWNR